MLGADSGNSGTKKKRKKRVSPIQRAGGKRQKRAEAVSPQLSTNKINTPSLKDPRQNLIATLLRLANPDFGFYSKGRLNKKKITAIETLTGNLCMFL